MKTFGAVAGDDTASTRYRVLAAVRDTGPVGRAELARQTGLAASTITAVTKSLVSERVLLEGAEPTDASPRSGPRSRGLSINPQLAAVAGVDFGFRTVRVAVCDLSARELAVRESRLSEQYSSSDGLAVAQRLYREALAEAALDLDDVLTVGVALPGPIDVARQRVVGSSVLPGWAGVDSGGLAEVFGTTATMENDANLAALGEHTFGAGRDVADSLTVKFHSGIGAGVIIGDRLVSGVGSGEIGHFNVTADGIVCRCGKRGCLDTFASIPAVLTALSPRGDSIDMHTLLGMLRDGDARTRRVVSDAAALVGEAASRACLLFAPERVIVVGGMAQGGEHVVQPLAEALRRGLIPDAENPPAVVRGELAERATLMGAVALALTASGWLAPGG